MNLILLAALFFFVLIPVCVLGWALILDHLAERAEREIADAVYRSEQGEQPDGWGDLP